MKQANFLIHQLKAGETLYLPVCERAVRILFLCGGKAETDAYVLEERAVYIGDPQKALSLKAAADSTVLEILRYTETCEMQNDCYPYVLQYNDAPTYTEDCKSLKTTSRMLIPPRVVPRFAMGSVQTAGEDLIAPHRHPDVDQYFYGLPENNCILLVDDREQPFGNELLHIPLASEHGVKLESHHTCHYLWMDLLLNTQALEYMDEAHKMQGEQP